MNKVWGLVMITITALLGSAQAQTLAFPSAEGFGRFAKGGRGGRVLEVTTLNEDGPGSLREALEAQGPRIIVFRVGGVINLTRVIQVNHPYVTVAGQTAPGGGISIEGSNSWINFRTGEVIVRHIRMRNGNPDISSNTTNLYVMNPDPDAWGGDNTLWSENIMIDHVSACWSADDNIGIWGRVRNVSIQWSISSESTGALLANVGATRITVHHNLFATNYRRFPFAGGEVDVVNNVIYNWTTDPTLISGWQYGNSYAAVGNVVNNYYKEGLWNVKHAQHYGNGGEIHLLYVCNNSLYPNSCAASNATEVYVSGNKLRKFGASADEPARINSQYNEAAGSIKQSTARHPFPQVATTSAEQAYTDVLAKVGAMPRDSIDARVVHMTRTQTSPYPFQWTGYESNGLMYFFDNWDFAARWGWPKPAGGTPPVDTDHDGMPDSWETSNGLNPNSAADGPQDKDGDGYTNVEEYLNELADGKVGGPSGIGSTKPSPAIQTIRSAAAKKCPLDIFGRTINEGRGNANHKSLYRKVMERKLEKVK